MKIFGRSRLPTPGQPGISLFDIQARIGHSSPEVHSFFPRHLTVRRTLESAYADTPNSPPRMNADADARVDACLRWFQAELNPSVGMDQWLRDESTKRYDNSVKTGLRSQNKEKYRKLHAKLWNEFAEKQAQALEWADNMRFSDMTFSGQRVALFLRAIIAQPDIVILDEAFSGMDDRTRDKCQLFLEHGERVRQSVRLLTKEEIVSLRRNPLPSKYLVHFRKPSELNNTFTIKEGLTDKQALISVSHVKEEVPMSVRDVLFLPEAGSTQPCTFVKIRKKNLCRDAELWHSIWNVTRYQRGKGKSDDAKRLIKLAQEEDEEVMKRRPKKFTWPGQVQEARRVLLKGGPGATAKKEREKEGVGVEGVDVTQMRAAEWPKKKRRVKKAEPVTEDAKTEGEGEVEKPKRKRTSKKAEAVDKDVKSTEEEEA